MTDKTQLPGSISQHIDAANSPYLSICMQRPEVAGDATKWSIYQKNIIQRVNELNLEDTEWEGIDWETRTTQALSLIDVNAKRCGGWMIIMSKHGTDIYELSDKPDNIITFSDMPYLLPKITDNTQNLKGWVLAVDRDNPGFYRYDGQSLENRIEELDYRSYAEMEDIREPMAAVNYHTRGLTSVGGSQPSAKFHALGAAVDDYDEIQLKDFLEELAGAVESVIAGTGRPLVLAGDPKRVGWMKDALELFELHDEHIDLAGDALKPDSLLSSVSAVFENIIKDKQASRDLGDGAPLSLSGFEAINDAAKMGKVDTLYLLDPRDGLQESDSDERLKFQNMSAGSPKSQSNKLAIQVLSMGGRVEVPIGDTVDTGSESFATLRY